MKQLHKGVLGGALTWGIGSDPPHFLHLELTGVRILAYTPRFGVTAYTWGLGRGGVGGETTTPHPVNLLNH